MQKVLAERKAYSLNFFSVHLIIFKGICIKLKFPLGSVYPIKASSFFMLNTWIFVAPVGINGLIGVFI